ncbi:MAG: hypothetical protein PHW34_13470 [Hespellia sp.]|nr:hypothetical protein [Hespellia sp.]
MGSFTSFTSFDYQQIVIVPVIASFTTDGHITPIYVRIGGDPYKVDSFWIKSNFNKQLEFHCQIIDHGCLKPLLLTYYKNEDVWAIPK